MIRIYNSCLTGVQYDKQPALSKESSVAHVLVPTDVCFETGRYEFGGCVPVSRRALCFIIFVITGHAFSFTRALKTRISR